MRVLLLSTYPIKVPRHGGQKRVSAIAEEYERAGHEVRHVSICLESSYPDLGDHDIIIPARQFQDNPLSAVIGDVLMSSIFDEHGPFRDALVDRIRQFNPEVVQVEQSFLYKTIARVLKAEFPQIIRVHGSQNIESELKRQILDMTTSLPEEEKVKIVKQIESLERFAAKDADWTAVCTEADASKLRGLGAKDVVVAPNGIYKGEVEEVAVERQRQKLKADGINRFVLYVGSAHPPNLAGYRDLIGGSLGFLAEDERLIVVGGVADSVYSYIERLPNYIKAVVREKVQLLGMVDEKVLSSLLSLADVVILPILEGGGSNLKSAEAILADTKIVATTKSFRSYEKYLELPNIIIADEKDAFIRAIAKSLASKKVPRTKKEQELAGGVVWQNSLKNMVERLNKS